LAEKRSLKVGWTKKKRENLPHDSEE